MRGGIVQTSRCQSACPRPPSLGTHAEMKVLVVGNGAREHALCWKLRGSPLVKELYCAPGNVGMAKTADRGPIDPSSIVELADFRATSKVDLTAVGPELPLALGIADGCRKRDLPTYC